MRGKSKATGTRRGAGVVDAAAIEHKWQTRWRETACFAAKQNSAAEKFYNFDGGPFPNGPLHMGHVRTFVLGDVMARYQRMRGKNVLYCFEFDAFGLPNELAAEAQAISPAELTDRNIRLMREQMIRLGLSYDWRYVHTTSDPKYYRWTQWLFVRLFEAGLVYRANAELNWCPDCRTTLAHIQVESGRCWRCESAVERRSLTQWYIAISQYSERLYESLQGIEGFGTRLKNVLSGFIGASAGYAIDLAIARNGGEKLTVFIEEKDLCAAAGYVAISRTHPLVKSLAGADARPGSDPEPGPHPAAARRHKRSAPVDCHAISGWFTGLHAIDPRTAGELPIYVADSVEPSFAHGATLGFPGTGERDQIFARAHGIVLPDDDVAVDRTSARPETHYRVHDWLVSRQRAWGTPIPMIHCPQCGPVPVPDSELPLLLPDIPAGGMTSGLADNDGFSAVGCPRCHGDARRESDTLDCYFDVIWCFLGCANMLDDRFRFQLSDFEPWMPVDWFHNGLDSYFYMHLYRFLGHVLHDMGILDQPEPFRNYVGHDVVTLNGRKMSKHHGNVVSPESILDADGADILRIAVLWSSNPNKSFEWTGDGLDRARTLVADLWALAGVEVEEAGVEAGQDFGRGSEQLSKSARAVDRQVANAVRRATAFLEMYQYSGSINEINRLIQALKRASRGKLADDATLAASFARGRATLLFIIAPFAPHIAEEIWERLGHGDPIAVGAWPVPSTSGRREGSV